MGRQHDTNHICDDLFGVLRFQRHQDTVVRTPETEIGQIPLFLLPLSIHSAFVPTHMYILLDQLDQRAVRRAILVYS